MKGKDGIFHLTFPVIHLFILIYSFIPGMSGIYWTIMFFVVHPIWSTMRTKKDNFWTRNFIMVQFLPAEKHMCCSLRCLFDVHQFWCGNVGFWLSGLRWSCCPWEIHSELLKIFSLNLEHSNVPTLPYYIKLKCERPVSISRPIKNNVSWIY